MLREGEFRAPLFVVPVFNAAAPEPPTPPPPGGPPPPPGGPPPPPVVTPALPVLLSDAKSCSGANRLGICSTASVAAMEDVAGFYLHPPDLPPRLTISFLSLPNTSLPNPQ